MGAAFPSLPGGSHSGMSCLQPPSALPIFLAFYLYHQAFSGSMASSLIPRQFCNQCWQVGDLHPPCDGVPPARIHPLGSKGGTLPEPHGHRREAKSSALWREEIWGRKNVRMPTRESVTNSASASCACEQNIPTLLKNHIPSGFTAGGVRNAAAGLLGPFHWAGQDPRVSPDHHPSLKLAD